MDSRALPGRERRLGILLVLAFLAVYILPLGSRPLAVPDEARYGEIAREMIAGGDWVSPHFNGVRYFEKPVLGHWVNAGSLALFGENPFAVRLPQALATGLTALLILLFMARFSTAIDGLVAAGIYLTSLEVLGVGTFSVLDPLLTLFLTAAVMTYFWADREPDRSRRLMWLVLCGAACGGAFLSKGFLAYAVPVLVIAPYLASERAWRKLLVSGWLPLAVSIAVALPWGVLIALREPDFWHYFFFVEHLQRLAADNAQHSRPSWYFIALLPLLAFPWIYLLPAVLGKLRTESPRLLTLLLVWIAMPLLFFSLARGKLATYILPCFPPFAMLIAIGLSRYLATPATRALRFGLGCLIAINAAALLALVASHMGLVAEPVYGIGEGWREGMLYAAFAIALGLAIAALRTSGRPLALIAIACALLPTYVFGTLALPQRIRESKTPVPFLEAAARRRRSVRRAGLVRETRRRVPAPQPRRDRLWPFLCGRRRPLPRCEALRRAADGESCATRDRDFLHATIGELDRPARAGRCRTQRARRLRAVAHTGPLRWLTRSCCWPCSRSRRANCFKSSPWSALAAVSRAADGARCCFARSSRSRSRCSREAPRCGSLRSIKWM
jgi:4-amino-4-deoxy-L-arabinose transferase